MYKKPFKYDPDSQRVVDANGIDVCMMRGWSDLRKKMNANSAIEVQDHWGAMIAHLLNENVGKESLSKRQSDKNQDSSD